MTDLVSGTVLGVFGQLFVSELLLKLGVDPFGHIIKYLVNLIVHFGAYFVVPNPIVCC